MGSEESLGVGFIMSNYTIVQLTRELYRCAHLVQWLTFLLEQGLYCVDGVVKRATMASHTRMAHEMLQSAKFSLSDAKEAVLREMSKTGRFG